MICTKCGEPDAVALIHSILCPNKKCNDFDQKWSEEVSANKKEAAAKKSVKEAVEKARNLKKDRPYILDSFGNKIFLLETNTSASFEGSITIISSNNPITITLPDVTSDPKYFAITTTTSIGNTAYIIYDQAISYSLTWGFLDANSDWSLTENNTDPNSASPW